MLRGHHRPTADADLLVDLAPDATRRLIDALLAIGLRPRSPVDPLDFAREEVRRRWVEEKGMTVFSLWHPTSMMLEVDIFAYHPIDFERAWRRASRLPLAGDFVTVAHVDDLLALKRLSRRPPDAGDLDFLRALSATP